METELIIKSLGIKNFRSFDSNGILLDNLNKINLLIGKNNSGKSNVLKFLKILTDVKIAFGSFPNDVKNQHNRSNIPASIFFKETFEDLQIPEFLDNETNKRPEFRTQVADYFEDSTILEFKFVDNDFTISFKKNISNQYELYKNELAIAIINKFQINYGYRNPMDAVKRHYEKDFLEWLRSFHPKIIYIPDIRIIQEKNNIEKSNSSINGTNLISELSLMKNHEVGEDDRYQKFKSIEKKIAEILNVEKIEIHIPGKSKELVLVVDHKRWALENFGTGVHDLVMLCCMIMLNEKSLICIEEPEIHLHPELQRRFIKFLTETEHQYIITTHSNVFLDYLNDDISIYHVKYDGTKSYINKSLTNKGIKEIIDEMGYKASDLLQTNGIIWVEGPSDRIYLNKWLSLINSEIKEGIHYSIMFYGGRLLSHLSFEFDDQNELMKMMKINPNAFILLDKDKIPISKTKERVIQEIGIANHWVTKGKEIENYLSLQVVNKWLTGKNLNELEENVNLNKKFENIIKQYNPSIKYEIKKVVYAKEIIEYFNLEDLDYLDIKSQLQILEAAIKRWNENDGRAFYPT